MSEILFNLIASWPGLTGRLDRALLEDSLVLLDFLPPGQLRVIDVGSGGGLPGLPLRLARPDLSLTLLEANQRKAAFLVQAAATLGLSNVEVVARRAEEAGHDPVHREAYDFALARALAAMPVLVELCLPFVAVGGRLLAMKTDAAAEAAAAAGAISRLGGELVEIGAAATAAPCLGPVPVVQEIRAQPPRIT